MSFPQRLTLVLLAAFFISNVAASLVAWLSAGAILSRAHHGSAGVRASALPLFRLLPSAIAACVTAGILVPGYLAHERPGIEQSGVTLWLLAAAGAAIVAASIVTGVLSLVRTARLKRAWLAEARPAILPGAGMPGYEIDLPYPLVAVLGVVRPRLFVSSLVLRECSAPELAAIIEHERAHVRRADNLLRLLMEAAPDLLRLTRVPARIAAAWHRAVEHRADEAASERLELASALVRVSRLAASAAAFQLPASALYGGGAIDDRVRHLLTAGAALPAPGWAVALVAAGAASFAVVAAAAGTGAASGLAHRLLELMVSSLP